MRKLLAATCLTPLSFALLPAAANAEIVIGNAVTTPVLTSTGNDDIRISSAGSVKPASGNAVTIDSNDSVKNEGTIQITGSNNSAGIVANPGLTGNITNTGTITIDESFTPTDTDTDGDVDGPFAQGSNRFGIHVLSGGTFTGNIANSGNITVEGNASAGIAIDSILAGNLSLTGGTINVLGDNVVGVRTAAVNGNVNLTLGTIVVQGSGAVGLLGGNISGALVIQNSITSTGYRTVNPPADTSKLDADDLLQGGSAVVVAGNVGGGIIFDTRPADSSTTDTDEDDDGIPDASEGNAAITSFGAAPAVQIGTSAQAVTIGPVSSSSAGHGFVVKGTITGAGVYKNISATALSIGGAGQTVDIAGGATLGGTIRARAIEADATAVKIGAGATVPEIVVNGTVVAEGAGTAGSAAQAILIDAGATVNTIRNSGNIVATRFTGTTGTATAIIDKSGSVGLIENSGTIGVTNSGELGASATAIDLTANTTGATVRQLVVTTGNAPAMFGQIKFGSGSDLLDLRDGALTGDVSFGGGSNTLTMSGDAVMNGRADFGGGAGFMTLSGTSSFNGNLVNSAGVAATVGTGSTLNATNLGSVGLASLTTASGAILGVSIDSDTDTNTLYNVSGAANLGANNLIAVNLLSVGDVAGTYKVIQAGSLTGGTGLTSQVDSLPFLFDSSVDTSVANEVSLTIRVKTADELGINRSESDILAAVLNAADSDASVAGVLLDIGDSETLQDTLQEMLPDHAGGTFEAATKGSRLMGRALLDPEVPGEPGGWRFWTEQVAWATSKSIGATSDYKLGGWGATAGLEAGLGKAGGVGVTLAFLSGRDSRGANEMLSKQYEAGLYWRGQWGGLTTFARGTAAMLNFDSTRRFSGTADGETVERQAEGDWKGRLYSASVGAAYDLHMGRFTVRPSVVLEHYKLTEKSYDEVGGGSAFDLHVDKRSSDETAASTVVALGYDLLGQKQDSSWMRVELEGGYRYILSGSLGETTAHFGGGEDFTLTPEKRKSGWLAGLRLMGGGENLSLAGEVNAEDQLGKVGIGGRVTLQLAL